MKNRMVQAALLLGISALSPVAGATIPTYMLRSAIADRNLASETEIRLQDGDISPVLFAGGGISVVSNENSLFIAKDDNGSTDRPQPQPGEYDFMALVGFNAAADLDRSNYVLLGVPDQIDRNSINDYLYHELNSVQGKYIHDHTPMLQPTRTYTIGQARPHNMNTYIATSFGGTQQGADGRRYFFARPTATEIARITWAEWDAELNAFKTPEPTAHVNRARLRGGFMIDLSLNAPLPSGHNMSVDDLHPGARYQFTALIFKMQPHSAPATGYRAEAEGAQISGDYIVFPLDLTPESELTTAVDDVVALPQVIDRYWVDMAGHRTETPAQGINIEVTVMSDGSHVTVKRVCQSAY